MVPNGKPPPKIRLKKFGKYKKGYSNILQSSPNPGFRSIKVENWDFFTRLKKKNWVKTGKQN